MVKEIEYVMRASDGDTNNKDNDQEDGSSFADTMNHFFQQFADSLQTNMDQLILEWLRKE